MIVSLIVAVAQNGVIGRDNQLPWHLPEDLKYFKRVTMGKPVVMGRKTFESIGKPLPGRTNIVITRNSGYTADGVKVVHTLKEALALCKTLPTADDSNELMVIGGGEIFSESLLLADKLYLTRIHAEVVGDAYFPAFDEELWTETAAEHFSADDTNPYSYSFLVLERKQSN
jgi:dihydrofolate reductase